MLFPGLLSSMSKSILENIVLLSKDQEKCASVHTRACDKEDL